MTRLGAVTTAVAVVVAAAIVFAVTGTSGSSSYRVAAIFDTANQMVSGQQVKIAGAVVGQVNEIDLVPGPKAKIVMSIEPRFAPFRQDATCTILPEGLISENYVECDPGSHGAAIAPGADGVPTVPLSRTTIPFSLQDVLHVFAMPTDERLQVLLTELGIGTAGRGQDLAGLLQRADPALVSAQHALSILNAQRAQIATAVGQTDSVLSGIGAQSAHVRTFVDSAATVAATAAARRAALSATVRGLPAMLDAAQPALRSLSQAAASASPLLSDLRAAAPGLDTLTSTMPSFANAGTPALHALADAAAQGRPALSHALPVVKRLRTTTGQLAPLSQQLDELFVSLRSTGGVESTMQLLYTLAVLTSTYDSTSHLINFIAQLAPQCLAAEGAGKSLTGCSKAYNSQGAGTIPINDTSCGPQPPQNFWDNAFCPGALPAGIPTPALRSESRHRARAIHSKTTAATVTTGTGTQPPPATAHNPTPVQQLTNTVKQLVGGLTSGVHLPVPQVQQLLNYLLK